MAIVSTQAPTKAVIYTPARILALDVPGALSRAVVRIVAAADGGNISGRHLHMTGAAYAASVGRMSADSVGDAIAYAAVQFYNGTKTLIDLADAPNGKGKAQLPAWFGQAIRATFEGLKPANGCTIEQLRTCTNVIWGKIAEAKKPEAPKRENIQAPGAVTTSAPAAPDDMNTPSVIREKLRLAELAEAEARARKAGTVEAFAQKAKQAAFIALAAPAPEAAPVVVLSPRMSNDVREDAHAFILAHGEDKARAFLEALALTLAPVQAPTPVKRPRIKKTA